MKLKYEKNRKLYSGVNDTLKLFTDIKINNFVATDNEYSGEEVLNRILKKYNVKNIFSVLSSKDVGYTKNTPMFFKEALKKIELKADEVVFVGHDAEEIDSANKSDITTIEFNEYLGVDTKAHFKVRHFNKIYDIVVNLS